MASTLESRTEEGGASSRCADDPAGAATRYREALSLWLEWNRAYETATAQMFANRADVTAIQEIMDRMNELRRRAAELSKSLIAETGPR